MKQTSALYDLKSLIFAI